MLKIMKYRVGFGVSKCFLGMLLSASFAGVSMGAVTYTFVGKGVIYDGNSSVTETVVDQISAEMVVTSNNGNLNSNSSSFGIGDDSIDGVGEILMISFDKDVMVNIVDFSAIGADVTDGANIKIGMLSGVDLYTGQADFNGVTDRYTPSSPLLLSAGESITITGSDAGSKFGLQSINVSIVPEPSTLGMLCLSGLFLLRRNRIG